MIVELMQAQRLKKIETHVSGFILFTCKDGTSTYYPELTEIEKIYPHELTEMEQRETLEIKRDAARSQAEKFERMSENSLDQKNKRKYAARAKQWRERESEVDGQLKAMEKKPKPKQEKPKTEKPKPEQPKPSTANHAEKPLEKPEKPVEKSEENGIIKEKIISASNNEKTNKENTSKISNSEKHILLYMRRIEEEGISSFAKKFNLEFTWEAKL